MSPHSPAIFLQHSRSAAVIAALGIAHAITGNAANNTAKAKIATLCISVTANSSHTCEVDATATKSIGLHTCLAYSFFAFGEGHLCSRVAIALGWTEIAGFDSSEVYHELLQNNSRIHHPELERVIADVLDSVCRPHLADAVFYRSRPILS
jgi:hypothetical protein